METAIFGLICLALGIFAGSYRERRKYKAMDAENDTLKISVSNWKFLHGIVKEENLARGKRLHEIELKSKRGK